MGVRGERGDGGRRGPGGRRGGVRFRQGRREGAAAHRRLYVARRAVDLVICDKKRGLNMAGNVVQFWETSRLYNPRLNIPDKLVFK